MNLLENFSLKLNTLTNRVKRMPILVLMPHSRCNCRCLMCDIWRANKNMQELEPKLIERHVKALEELGVRWIVLSGGEALMHSNLRNLCESLAPLNARTTLLSTGLLLERDAELISEHIDDVIVSLDGSEAVHDRIRNIPRAFEKLERGVSALRRVAPDIDVGARCVLQRENYRDVIGIVQAAKTLGLDWVSFLAADVSSNAFNRPDGWTNQKVEEVGLTLDQCADLVRILRQSFVDLKEEFESGYVVESPGKLLRIVNYYRALHGDAEFAEQRCNAPWVSAVVEPDGHVLPCYFHEAYGNLNDATLTDILNSPSAIEFRRRLDVNQDPICKRCVCTLNFQ